MEELDLVWLHSPLVAVVLILGVSPENSNQYNFGIAKETSVTICVYQSKCPSSLFST